MNFLPSEFIVFNRICVMKKVIAVQKRKKETKKNSIVLENVEIFHDLINIIHAVHHGKSKKTKTVIIQKKKSESFSTFLFLFFNQKNFFYYYFFLLFIFFLKGDVFFHHVYSIQN